MIESDPHNGIIDILWITSAACKSTGAPPKETKCYIIDHTQGNSGLQATFIDLSGLVRPSGFPATMAERPDLILNVTVCRPISEGACQGAMMCLYRKDSALELPSKAPMKLAELPSDYTSSGAVPHYPSGEDELTVEYEISSVVDSSCGDGKSSAKIRFFCPTGDEVRALYVLACVCVCVCV